LEGCIIIEHRFYNVGTIRWKLFFYQKFDRSNERKIALPIDELYFVGTPQTVYKEKYNYATTNNHQNASTENLKSFLPTETNDNK
ncbi:MAG: hypothetical protein ACKO96_03655, partial [Flammeovirgaceae bacterium]